MGTELARSFFAEQLDVRRRVGEFVFGCASQYAEAICVRDAGDGRLEVRFDGEALARAVITRMELVVRTVEVNSGIPWAEVGAFATHQPKPRLVTLLAKQRGVAVELFPAAARVSGNLGSSTCGVALAKALEGARADMAAKSKPIFLASLGPAFVWRRMVIREEFAKPAEGVTFCLQ